MGKVLPFPMKQRPLTPLAIQTDVLFKSALAFLECSSEARATLGALLALEVAVSGDITPFQRILLYELKVD